MGGDDTSLICADCKEMVPIHDLCPKLPIVSVGFIHVAVFLFIRPRITSLCRYILQPCIERSVIRNGRPVMKVPYAKDKWVSVAFGSVSLFILVELQSGDILMDPAMSV